MAGAEQSLNTVLASCEYRPSLDTIFHEDPAVHWLSQCTPNQYRFMNSTSSASADHNFSGVVRM